MGRKKSLPQPTPLEKLRQSNEAKKREAGLATSFSPAPGSVYYNEGADMITYIDSIQTTQLKPPVTTFIKSRQSGKTALQDEMAKQLWTNGMDMTAENIKKLFNTYYGYEWTDEPKPKPVEKVTTKKEQKKLGKWGIKEV